MKSTLFALILWLGLSGSAWADRVKDLASVAAGRTNQLIGYGLVVGLQGTGDGADVSFTAQSMKAMLSRLGVSLEGPLSDFDTAANAGKVDIKNAAAVMVTAELPGFAKPGQKIDINVSAIGKASSLRRPTASFRNSPTSTIRTSNRAVPTFPAVSASVCALRVRC